MDVFTISVIGPSKREAPLTEFGKESSSLRIISNLMVEEWEPKHSEDAVMHVNRLYDMTRSGKYRIVVSRSVKNENGVNGTARTNEIVVEIK